MYIDIAWHCNKTPLRAQKTAEKASLIDDIVTRNLQELSFYCGIIGWSENKDTEIRIG